MDKLVLIDGNSLVNRAYFALPPLFTPQGDPVHAVYGFANMLVKAIEDIKPTYLAVAFDLRAPTFRHKAYAEYKATRKGMPEQLAVQMPILKEMLRYMGIKILECEGFEADDIIGTMAKRNKTMTYIITGDRDSLQLIDETTTVMLTKRGLSDVQSVDTAELKRSYFLTPSQVIDYKALAGDSSDNIPGVSGIGDKSALALLEKYTDLDNIYAHINEITGMAQTKLIADKENAYLSRMLATIETKMELPCELSECAYEFPFMPQVHSFFVGKGFKTLIKRTDLFNLEGSSVKEALPTKPIAGLKVVSSIEELKEILANGKTSMAISIGDNINLAFESTQEYVVNLAYSLIDNGLDFVEVMTALKPYLENEKLIKVVYDAKALKHRLKKDFRIQLLGYKDVKLAQYLVDMTVNYASLSAMQATYAIDECEIATGILYMMDRLDAELCTLKMNELYYGIELPLVDILYNMECEGFNVDLKLLDKLNAKFNKKQAELEVQIFELCGKPFNVRSPKQLAKILFEDMGIPYPVKKATSFSTGAEILEQVAEGNPIIGLVLEYRFVTKLNSTYIEGLKKLVDSKSMVHTEFKQMLTTTGRLSSVEPNLQNIPVREEEGKVLRGLFVAPEGYTLVTADYSQIELRLMAHFSSDQTMLNAYKNNEDIHTSTAALVFNVPTQEVTSKMRRAAKAVNFGIIYGISDYGLSTNLKISRQEAKQYIENYFAKFSGVKSYLENSVSEAKKKGSVCTLLGRVRKIPELFAANFSIRQFGERAAMNMPLQGSAADIIKIAMINVSKALSGKKSRLILQIHDELIVCAANEEVDQVRKLLREGMENAISLKVPLTVDIGQGKSWLDCK